MDKLLNVTSTVPTHWNVQHSTYSARTGALIVATKGGDNSASHAARGTTVGGAGVGVLGGGDTHFQSPAFCWSGSTHVCPASSHTFFVAASAHSSTGGAGVGTAVGAIVGGAGVSGASVGGAAVGTAVGGAYVGGAGVGGAGVGGAGVGAFVSGAGVGGAGVGAFVSGAGVGGAYVGGAGVGGAGIGTARDRERHDTARSQRIV